MTDALEQELIPDLIGPPVGLRMLELGCGDGAFALELAARGASVVGIDASPQVIVAARDRAAREGREGEALFEVARIEDLSFGNEPPRGCFGVSIAGLKRYDAGGGISRVGRPQAKPTIVAAWRR